MPPMVIMTSHGSERVAVEAIRAGAVDYLVKSEVALADLPHIAERAVRHRRVEEALGDLVAGTAAAGGEALFGELVLRLARALRVKYASVAELVDGEHAADARPVRRRPPRARTSSTRSRARRAPASSTAASATSATASPTATRRTRGCGGSGRRATWGPRCAPRPARSWASSTPSTTGPSTRSCAPRASCRSSPRGRRRRSSGCGPSARSSGSGCSPTASSTWWPRWSSSWTPTAGSCASTGPASRRAAGRRRSCGAGAFWEELRPPEAREEASRYYQGGNSALELPVAFESEWLTRSGERRLISWINRPVFDATGEVTYVLGTGHRRHRPAAAGGRPAPRRVRVAGDLRRPAPRRRGGGRGGADRPRQPDRGRALGPREMEGPHRRSARRARARRALGGPRRAGERAARRRRAGGARGRATRSRASPGW